MRPQAAASAGGVARLEGPRLAIIGCGAIAESLHIPALARHPDLARQAILVDVDLERAMRLCRERGFGGAARDYREVLADVDGAIVTTPHHLHYPIALDLLESGKSVLCEKPLTETAHEARHLLEVAREAGAKLAVNHTRRLFPAYRRVADLLRDGAIGKPMQLEMLWGEVFDWPAATGSYFGRMGAGKGVLLDKGPHLIDVICWWLGGKPKVIDYFDDSFGGSEAVAEVRLEAGECAVTVALSWLSRYENGYVIRGEHGEIRGGIYDWRTLELREGRRSFRTIRCPSNAASPAELRYDVVDNFLQVLRGEAAPVVAGEDALCSVEIIEDCYNMRQRLPLPWHQPVRLPNE